MYQEIEADRYVKYKDIQLKKIERFDLSICDCRCVLSDAYFHARPGINITYTLRGGFFYMKIIVTAAEAQEKKGIWPQVMRMFGRDENEDIWPKEEFILTEDQARELKLIQ